MDRKYKFSWDLLGDIKEGRPNLGEDTKVAVYRLMQFTFRDVIEQKMGSEETDRIFFEAGKLAGKELYNALIIPTNDFNEFVKQLKNLLKDLGIGILRIELSDVANKKFELTVAEDLDCSGLPDLGTEICTYDEGFIASLFECFVGEEFNVKEVDCWCLGDRTCRFVAEANSRKKD